MSAALALARDSREEEATDRSIPPPRVPRARLRLYLASCRKDDGTVVTYDQNGNQTIKTKNGAGQGCPNAAGGPFRHPASQDTRPSLGIAGCAGAAVTTTFVYDVRDQLISVQENTTTLGQFFYDYAGLRIAKSGADGFIKYVYDGKSVLIQTNSQGTTFAKYDYGPDRLLSINHTTEGRQFYLFDALRSTVNLTKTDGSISARYQYDAWGQLLNTVSSWNKFTYTGHEQDKETGLYYFKARFYDPDTGRFLTQDPYQGDINTPPSLHRYLYAYANPVVYVDLNGYDAIDIASGIATSVTNLIFGGDLEFYEDTELQKQYNAQKSFGEGRLQKRYEVDLRTWSIKKEINVGPTLTEQLTSTLTLGIPDFVKSIGKTAGAISVRSDSGMSSETRNQADRDIGEAVLPTALVALPGRAKGLGRVEAVAPKVESAVVAEGAALESRVVSEQVTRSIPAEVPQGSTPRSVGAVETSGELLSRYQQGQNEQTLRRFLRQDEFSAIENAIKANENITLGRYFTPDAITDPRVAASQLALPGVTKTPVVGYVDVPRGVLPSEPLNPVGPRLVLPFTDRYGIGLPGGGLEVVFPVNPVVSSSKIRLIPTK